MRSLRWRALISTEIEGARTLFWMISGAMYSGVPHNVYVRPLTRLAKPKSVICPPQQVKVIWKNVNLSSLLFVT